MDVLLDQQRTFTDTLLPTLDVGVSTRIDEIETVAPLASELTFFSTAASPGEWMPQAYIANPLAS